MPIKTVQKTGPKTLVINAGGVEIWYFKSARGYWCKDTGHEPEPLYSLGEKQKQKMLEFLKKYGEVFEVTLKNN